MLHVLTRQWFLITILLGVIFLGAAITARLPRTSTQNYFTDIEYFSLGISGWLIPVFFWALFVHLFLLIVDSTLPVVIVTGSFVIFFLFKSGTGKVKKLSPVLTLLLFIFLFSIPIFMVFISRSTFPAYFDSAEHYRIIKFLLGNQSLFVEQWPTPSYYHIGYHLILSAIIKLTGTGIIDGILVSGQLALATLGISLFFIIKRETASNVAAFFTTLLAGFGWYMPGHAINWGKYPAVFGLICIIFVINLMYVILQKKSIPFNAKKLLPMLIAAGFVSTLIHTRSLVVCVFFTIALILANIWERFTENFRRFIFGLLLLALISFGVYLRTDDTFTFLLSPYLENDFIMLSLVFLLAIFSAWKFPKFTFVLVVFISMLFISLYIPVYGLFGYENLFLLDRPYIQILLSIIFSLVGGLGFAGLLNTIKTTVPIKLAIQTAVFGILAINAIFYQEYYPSECCELTGKDDAAAFSWIQHELPQQAVLLIASQNISLTPNSSLVTMVGIDAGIWISPITGRITIPFYSDTDFADPVIHIQICEVPVEYIYLGNKSGGFNENSLMGKPEWYQNVLALPEAKIYQLIGCP